MHYDASYPLPCTLWIAAEKCSITAVVLQTMQYYTQLSDTHTVLIPARNRFLLLSLNTARMSGHSPSAPGLYCSRSTVYSYILLELQFPPQRMIEKYNST